MSLIDVAIPGIIGLLLAANPHAFIKTSGDAATDAAKVRKFRRIGQLLLVVAGVYLVAKLLFMADGTA